MRHGNSFRNRPGTTGDSIDTGFASATYTVFQGTTGDDYFRGATGRDAARDDWIAGFQGNDDLGGGAGDDHIDGGNDNDLLEGGTGNDTLIGGDGIDAANYVASRAGIHADLATGIVLDGTGSTDMLTEIEVVLGSKFADTILGSAIDEDFRGGRGDDILNGGEGNDMLRGDKGDDVLDGGAGFDTADYFYTRGVIVDLSLGTATARGHGTDRLAGIEGVIGSRSNDRITGDAAANDLRGEAGNDHLVGGAGDDAIDGGAGRDILTGGAGTDTMFGGTGADRFVFAQTDLGTTLTTADRIGDFSQGDHDRIILSTIDADVATDANDAFVFIGDAAFTGAAGELRAAVRSGYTVIEGDVNGDMIADGVLVLAGEHHLAVTDFVL